MNKLHMSSSPHIHSGRTTPHIMLDVLIALSPAAIAGCVIFGWRALLVLLVSVGSALLAEAVYNWIVKKEQTIGDLTAAVTGLLLGLNLPANAPLWQATIGSVFAIIVVKCLFGGLGCNLVNPAITARVFMLVAFGSLATPALPAPYIPEAATGATPLTQLANGETPNFVNLLLGTTGGSIGETYAIALLLGFAYLLVRGVVTWHIPVSFVGTAFLFTLFLEGFDVVAALAWMLSGGLLLGAIFMATDYVTSPVTKLGKIVFGVGCGLLTVIIRFFGSYPEGVSFAILFMNILNPYIETLTPRKLFGRRAA